ncbi:hypothetical protein HYFRA_00012223 [Hymenoscyphus fraxineus]|uniref:Uncharacterized protein n=1 Tax=Hymenoscyphus fraxineus TaxID=746836 RepID=A0A9N9L045_9HELO|nr:hypothetical protein HYFRA_00012223 [Hymenoscyphus fraxineus]
MTSENERFKEFTFAEEEIVDMNCEEILDRVIRRGLDEAIEAQNRWLDDIKLFFKKKRRPLPTKSLVGQTGYAKDYGMKLRQSTDTLWADTWTRLRREYERVLQDFDDLKLFDPTKHMLIGEVDLASDEFLLEELDQEEEGDSDVEEDDNSFEKSEWESRGVLNQTSTRRKILDYKTQVTPQRRPLPRNRILN